MADMRDPMNRMAQVTKVAAWGQRSEPGRCEGCGEYLVGDFEGHPFCDDCARWIWHMELNKLIKDPAERKRLQDLDITDVKYRGQLIALRIFPGDQE
jgi:hypothetical protein